MSVYMSRLFPRSNSSFFLRSGIALDAKLVRLREDMYLVDSGMGQPQIATAEELIKPPKHDGPARFSSRVGYLNPSNEDVPVRTQILQRFFIDLVTGDERVKQQAAARFDDLVGRNDAVSGGEQPLLLPRRFRKQRTWVELMNKWRSNAKVRGFFAQKVKGGYSIGIAGYLAFVPYRQVMNTRLMGDRFIIQRIAPRNILLAKAG